MKFRQPEVCFFCFHITVFSTFKLPFNMLGQGCIILLFLVLLNCHSICWDKAVSLFVMLNM